MPHEKYPLLFSPIKVRNTVFRNRIMTTPTSLSWADFWSGAPEDMTEEMMHLVAEDFANAALAAKNNGFGMVQVHGAHGWLLGQFQSGATNWRKDEYGGSVENRARFPLMVVKAIREKVGEDFLVEYRMSGDEHLEGGIVGEEAAEFASIIQDYVDIIHVSAGSYYTAREYTFPGSYQPRDTNTHLAAMVKKVRTPDVKAPRKVMVIGGGPGGMQAAITAADRGHEVALVEMQDTIAPEANRIHKDSMLEALNDPANSSPSMSPPSAWRLRRTACAWRWLTGPRRSCPRAAWSTPWACGPIRSWRWICRAPAA